MNKKELNNAFIKACENGDLDKVKYFLTSPELKKHADIHAKDDLGLQLVCTCGHFEIVKYLLTSPDLKEHADIQHAFDGSFVGACHNGHLEVIRYLLSPDFEEHTNIHVIDDYGFRFACTNGHLDVVKYLLTSPDLKEHANIHACDDWGFQWACRRGHDMIIDFIVHHENFISNRLELCLDKIGEQRVFETLSTLSQEQQNYFYDMHKDFFDEHFDELFPLYLENGTPLPDGLCKEKQEEIEILI